MAAYIGAWRESQSGKADREHEFRLKLTEFPDPSGQCIYFKLPDYSIEVDDELVDDIYAMLSDRHYRRFLLRVAKSTRDRFMLADLAKVTIPTMIIWGRDDTITPPFVAEKFCENIDSAELVFIDDCGHAPPIEQPDEFTRHLHEFLGDMTSYRDYVPWNPR